ncbi:MAG: SUMF1/EgtB/PvdO family nonheme iron enzyme [Desulfobacterales bacterium]|nr:SUMF1/EgtB/PvdO family nonheme iron enzyme [Desulfobacterales bacterium]
MKHLSAALQCFLALFILAGESHPQDRNRLAGQNEALFLQLRQVHQLTDEQMAKIRAVFAASGYMGQGNPAITQHPFTTEQCEKKLESQGVTYANGAFEKICGAKYMAPLYKATAQKPEDARSCIDQFEFPNIPAAYPVVWVRTREAAELCGIQGKRLCDAHEWEGACAGSLEEPDYRFDLARGKTPEQAIGLMREAHNRKYGPSKSWSYGPAYRKGVCAASSRKSPACTGGSWSQCGSNTFPAGSFPECASSLQVYDLNGNAAEHMNLPLNQSQMSSRGSRELGYTEMKGSWFIFDTYPAHQDWCRWRAPFWHGSRVLDKQSHQNYHLGFRCCKSIHGENTASR